MFNNVVECDVSVVAEGSNQSRRPQSREGRKRMFWRAKTGEYEVEPHHIGLQFADRVQQTHWSCQAVEIPAADYVEAWKFRQLRTVKRFSTFVRSEFIVGQFVRENGQTDFWIAL